MCVNNLPKVATQWNSGATRDSNRSRRVLIPSALTTRPPSHTTTDINYTVSRKNIQHIIHCNLKKGLSNVNKFLYEYS